MHDWIWTNWKMVKNWVNAYWISNQYKKVKGEQGVVIGNMVVKIK